MRRDGEAGIPRDHTRSYAFLFRRQWTSYSSFIVLFLRQKIYPISGKPMPNTKMYIHAHLIIPFGRANMFLPTRKNDVKLKIEKCRGTEKTNADGWEIVGIPIENKHLISIMPEIKNLQL